MGYGRLVSTEGMREGSKKERGGPALIPVWPLHDAYA